MNSCIFLESVSWESRSGPAGARISLLLYLIISTQRPLTVNGGREREYHIILLILELFQTQDSVAYIILDTLDLFDFCFNV